MIMGGAGAGGPGQGIGRIDYEGEDARAGRLEAASIRRVLRAFVPYWPLALGIFHCVLAGAAFGIVPPLLVRNVVDDALASGDTALLLQLVGAMITAAVLAGLAQVAQNWLNIRMGQLVMYDLRVQLYERVQEQSLRFFTATPTGAVMSRLLNDVNGVQDVLTRSLVQVVNNAVIIASVVAVMVSINWRMALVALAVLPVFILPVRTAGRMRARIARETQGKMAEVSSRMQESLGINGVLLMKVFGRQELERGRFREASRELMELQVRQGLVGRWFQMLVGLYGTVSPAVLFGYGGWEVANGTLTVGGVIAFTALMQRIYTPVSQLLNIHIDMLASLGLFARIFAYLDMQPDVQDAPGAVRPGPARGLVRFEDVHFGYERGRPALSGVTFEAQPGQLVALVGPSGAGKSTVVSLVPRLYDPDAGTVAIDGHDLRSVPLAWIGEQLAMVPQETFLFHTTVRENLRYGNPAATEEQLVAAAQAANIHDVILGLPQGYDTVVGQRGFRLSGGERQRIAIARALLKDPRIILLDEATSALDSRSERLVQEALERLMQGRTSIVIAHRLSTVLSADLILVLDRGRIVERGTHAELLAHGGLYAQLYREQFAQAIGEQREDPAAIEQEAVAAPTPVRTPGSGGGGGGGRGTGGGGGGGRGRQT